MKAATSDAYNIFYARTDEVPFVIRLESSKADLQGVKAFYTVKDSIGADAVKGEGTVKGKCLILPEIPSNPGSYTMSLRFEKPDGTVRMNLATLNIVEWIA